MRVTSSMYYNNIFGANNSKTNKNLFDVNKQIASGLKIQYASDDIGIFVDTMRLDNELTTLEHVKKSAETGFQVSTNTDATLNSFNLELVRMKTLLIKAGNDTNDSTSLDAIVKELKGVEGTLQTLANTSVNGRYLFSGSAFDVKPISDDGSYNGNDIDLNAFLGSNNKQAYNITGSDLFLGEESSVKREVTSNVVQKSNVGDTLDVNTTMGDFMGVIPATSEHSFYIRGVQSDGTSFNERIGLGNADTVGGLLVNIGELYGNDGAKKVVDVSMNESGQIIISDKLSGSSKLDFHMVGASDFSALDHADITDAGIYGANAGEIDVLESPGNGSTDYATALTSPTQLYIREFNVSGYTPATGAPTLEGLVYDRTEFAKNSSTLSSSIPQINKETNAFATVSTKISEVADLSHGTVDSLHGTQFLFNGKDINGTAFTAQIDFKDPSLLPVNTGSTFSLDGGTTNYKIFDMNTVRGAVNANDMTYGQLMDVINLAVTGTTVPPAGTNNNSDGSPMTIQEEYDKAIGDSHDLSNTYLKDGKIEFHDKSFLSTKATLSMYDSNSGKFGAESSALSFNSNNSLTVRDPKTDFFKTISDVIKSVEEYKNYPDPSSGGFRTIGTDNSIAMIDDLKNHVLQMHSTAGAQSNRLESSLENTAVLELSTITLRAEVLDTDLAESALRLQQLTLNQQAMLSTIGRVSKLSLVNYL